MINLKKLKYKFIKKKTNVTRFKSFRLLIYKMKLLLLSRLIKKLLLNETFIINILLYHNYLSNEEIRK